jgi:hypothetical protein
MDPYEALGVTPSTPLPEIETAYRLLLRRYHPDVHYADGPQAVADAESMTQQLTLAMAHVRADHGMGARPADGSRHGSHRRDHQTAHGPAPRDGTAWTSGTARDPGDGPVPCPYCRQPFVDLDQFMHHLETRHHGPNPAAAMSGRTYKPNRFIDTLGTLRFIPSWLLAGIILLGVCVQQSPNVWLATLLFVLVVSWSKTSRRYKHGSRLNHL